MHLIVSRPEYFEKAVIPHIQSANFKGDPVDSAVKEILEPLFPNDRIIYDYDMKPNRLPVMLGFRQNLAKLSSDFKKPIQS